MKKIFLPFFIIFFSFYSIGQTSQRHEWHGCIPVCLKEGKPYFLLRKQIIPLVESQKEIFTPFTGENLYDSQQASTAVQEQINSFIDLTTVKDIDLFIKKLPYLMIEEESSDNHQEKDVRFWWPSFSSQMQKMASVFPNKLKREKPTYDFFGIPSKEEEEEKTNLKAVSYRIYFVPVQQVKEHNDLIEKSQWLSIEEIIAINKPRSLSSFLEKLTEMFSIMNKMLYKSDNSHQLITYDIQSYIEQFFPAS